MTDPGQGGYWYEEGTRIGEAVGFAAAIVVVGTDGDAAFELARGVATVQAARRRVMIGELFGTIAALRDALPDEDPHGIADCFEYGISFARVAHPSREDPRIDLAAAGADIGDLDAVLGHRRWRRIAAGFREAGDLLLIVAPAHAAGTITLVDRFDGALVLGPDVPAALPVARVIKLVPAPGTARVFTSTPAAEAPAGAPVEGVEHLEQSRTDPDFGEAPTVAVRDRAPLAEALEGGLDAPPARRSSARMAGLALAAVLVAITGWLAYRPLAQMARRIPLAAPAETLPLPTAAPDPALGLRPDSVPAGAAGAPVPINPGDSAVAAAYAVEVTAANTQAGAILKLREQGGTLPASTFSPVLVQGATWFRVTTGAFATREGADSLLGRLRASGALDSTAGHVVLAPFAFLVDSGLAPAAVPQVLPSLLAQRGLPVYALRQTNGTAWILAGAFETPAQALLYAESLRAAGIAPTLVYRKGRVF